MAYTRDGIMAQIWVAFGQGTGEIRVSQEAAMELHRWYYNAISERTVKGIWDVENAAVLERIRAIGRLAAVLAVTAGATVVSVDNVNASVIKVQETSDTWLCPETAGVPNPKTL